MDQRLLEIGIKKRNGEISDTWDELARGTRFRNGTAYRLWVKNQLKRNLKKVSQPPNQDQTPADGKETVEIHADGSQSSHRLVRMSIEESKDPEFLLRAHGYSVDAWELVSARSNIWNAYSKQDGIQTLYSSRITVKPRVGTYDEKSFEEFLTRLSRDYKSPVHTPVNFSRDGKLLELNIADLHLGKLCWTGDSGDHYDEEVARKRFFHIINDVISKTRHYKYQKILFVWSNDFFHFDTVSGTTTKGTPLDTNLRWQQMFELGAEMLVQAIDLLSQFAPVETFYIASNHDKMISYFATMYLAAWYKDNKSVTINTDPRSRKFYKFGKCLIGFTHGNQEKKRIGKWLQVEAAKEWGETIYREVHAAHIHSEKLVDEDNGVIVRYVSSPTGTDNWHYDSAYIGAVKKGQSFLWDAENGLELIINSSVV